MIKKTLFILTIIFLIFLAFYVGKYRYSIHMPGVAEPSPKLLTAFEVAQMTLQKNPNYRCPDVLVMDQWIGKFKGSNDFEGDMMADSLMMASCFIVYQQQYFDEANALNQKQAQLRQPTYVPQIPQIQVPQFHSTTCHVYGNTVRCSGF